MSCLFGKIPFVWLIFEDDNEEEEEEEEERVDFCIEEIRCCDCFFDKVLYFIEKIIIKLISKNYLTSSFMFQGS